MHEMGLERLAQEGLVLLLGQLDLALAFVDLEFWVNSTFKKQKRTVQSG
jgi:hypothetical protein